MEPSEYFSSTQAVSMLNSQDNNFFMMISSKSLLWFALTVFAAGLEIIDNKAKSEPISN